MYTPRHNLIKDEATIRDMVAAVRTAWFVTADEDGIPQATFLPIIWRENSVIMHVARDMFTIAPARMAISPGLTPAARTWTRTSPGPSSASGTSAT
ncbi:MAG: FMN-binding negative transcriptional regulator [Ramlibacter sp.]|nr:FMN-binding negative transcriptional regulator [Cryobacterium sp.]